MLWVQPPRGQLPPSCLLAGVCCGRLRSTFTLRNECSVRCASAGRSHNYAETPSNALAKSTHGLWALDLSSVDVVPMVVVLACDTITTEGQGAIQCTQHPLAAHNVATSGVAHLPTCPSPCMPAVTHQRLILAWRLFLCKSAYHTIGRQTGDGIAWHTLKYMHG